jgi:hypothetical protein
MGDAPNARGKAAFGTEFARFMPTLNRKLILIHTIDFV